MTVRLELAALDAADIAGLAGFYAELTGWRKTRDVGDWITLTAADGQEVGFQAVPGHVPPGPAQMFLTLLVDDVAVAAGRALSLGATDRDGELHDPAGHPFALVARAAPAGTVDLESVTVDAPQPEALAAFWSEFLSLPRPDPLTVAGGGRRLRFRKVDDYVAPRWPDPAFPQQAHFDVLVDDLDEAESSARSLGAQVLRSPGGSHRTLADPAGHPFDITL